MQNVALELEGFVEDDTLASARAEKASQDNMHQTGPYVIHGVWRKGAVTLVFEQNTAAEEMGGGMSAVIQHPAVCVVSGPKGSAACNPADVKLILALAEELA